MSFIKYIFTPNYVKYEGVRPINIYLLRVLYFLMFAGVGLQTRSTIINHQGPWDHTRAVAFCVWATCPTLSIFGLIRPLQWLPIVIFMIFYKALRCRIVVDAGLAVFVAVHSLPGARGKEPVKHFKSANAERILKILVRPGAVTID